MIGLASIAVLLSSVSFTLSTVDDLPVLNKLLCKDCERVYVPVCGSDNTTYTNACRLRCWNDTIKQKSDQVHILFYGTCVENIVNNMY